MKLLNLMSFIKKLFQKDTSIYTDILIWAYKKRDHGFTREEIDKTFKFSVSKTWIERVFFIGMNGASPLIMLLEERDRMAYYSLSAEGTAIAVNYLELQSTKMESKISIGIAIIAIIFAGISCVLTETSNHLAYESLQLSAPIVLDIIPNQKENNSENDPVMLAAGMIYTGSSTAKLLLVNNSISTIDDVDIRMTLWSLDRDPDGVNFEACPMGYVDHFNNPNFKVSNMRVDNVLHRSVTLNSNDSYAFNLDYQDIKYVNYWGKSLSESAAVFVKIDVVYKKRIGDSKDKYTKIFRLFNSDIIFDVDKDPESGYMVKNGTINVSKDLVMPSVFYPFLNEEFVNYLKSVKSPSGVAFGQCKQYSVSTPVGHLSY